MKIGKTILFTTGVLATATLGIARYAYNIAFKAPKRRNFRDYTLPTEEQYVPHHTTMKRCMDRLIEIPYEEITVTSFDGLKLFGRYYDASPEGISCECSADSTTDTCNIMHSTNQTSAPIHILFHGYKSNPYMDGCGGSGLVTELGHRFIVVDQRSHGESEGNTITFGINERRDCLTWVNYCIGKFGMDTPIILWGLSMGAATVLMASDLNLPANVKGIIADSPFSAPCEIIKKVCKDMHYPPTLLYPFVKLGATLYGHFDLEECSAYQSLANTKTPILLFHGDDDRFVPHEMSVTLSKLSPMVTFVSIPKAGHGLCYMTEAQTYHDSAIKFIESVLK